MVMVVEFELNGNRFAVSKLDVEALRAAADDVTTA
jgi:hypothetical protein